MKNYKKKLFKYIFETCCVPKRNICAEGKRQQLRKQSRGKLSCPIFLRCPFSSFSLFFIFNLENHVEMFEKLVSGVQHVLLWCYILKSLSCACNILAKCLYSCFTYWQTTSKGSSSGKLSTSKLVLSLPTNIVHLRWTIYIYFVAHSKEVWKYTQLLVILFHKSSWTWDTCFALTSMRSNITKSCVYLQLQDVSVKTSTIVKGFCAKFR